MLQTEFIRNLNCNYERILLDTSPEEKRYQYCIISRGGIKGLLPCSLRYINSQAYLYYDISSKQNVQQLYDKRPMTRQWLRLFLLGMRQMREELSRFLLDEQHILWFPGEIFQDLENDAFSFLYVPYYEEDNGFGKLLEFMIEHIDYKDETLVECVYHMYEQFVKNGWSYLQHQIFKDAEVLEHSEEGECAAEETINFQEAGDVNNCEAATEYVGAQMMPVMAGEGMVEKDGKKEKRGIRAAFRNKKQKDKELRDGYESIMQREMEGYAVAEEPIYEAEDWGRTIYIEQSGEETEIVHALYTREGRLLMQLDKTPITIGKKKEDADIVIEDISVSRLHAKIVQKENTYYIEDMNSTNGTFKNGLRLEPYEKRELDIGDEIRIGKKELIYR